MFKLKKNCTRSVRTTLCTSYAYGQRCASGQGAPPHRITRSRLDPFGVRAGCLQIPQEEQDPVRYQPLPVVLSVLPRRVLAAVTVRVLARAQVPLDLALVDQVVVLPFPDDPDTPEKNVARSHAKVTRMHMPNKRRCRPCRNCWCTAAAGAQAAECWWQLATTDAFPKKKKDSIRSCETVKQMSEWLTVRSDRTGPARRRRPSRTWSPPARRTPRRPCPTCR